MAPDTPYALLAAGVVVLHALFIAFAALGGLLALRWRWMPWLHLPALAWGAMVEVTGSICPLTPLEMRLRTAAGLAAYQGDFVGRYLLPLIYPDGLTPAVQVALGVALLAFNAIIYALVWRRRIGPDAAPGG